MIRVTLGAFARSGVESHFGDDVPAGVRAAVVRYADKLRGGRRLAAPPRFLADLHPPGCAFPVEMTVDAADEATYAAQARSQGTTVERLAHHAVLVYLAELEVLGATGD
jgi:hypothetical protein